MGYRDLGDIDSKIIDVIIRMGAAEGIENVSSKKIAAELDISSGTVFNHFGSMDEAIKSAAKSFDRPHIAAVIEWGRQGLSLYQIWDRTLEAFMDDPDGTRFYISYLSKFRYDPTGNDARNPEFLAAVSEFMSDQYHLADAQALILWEYVTNMMFYYAEKFISGYLSDTQRTRAFIKRIVFGGVNDIIGRAFED